MRQSRLGETEIVFTGRQFGFGARGSVRSDGGQSCGCRKPSLRAARLRDRLHFACCPPRFVLPQAGGGSRA